MTNPFQYYGNFLQNKEKYNLDSLKRLIKLNHDIIRVPQNGKMVKVVEQRGTCWLANDNLTFEYSGKSMKPQKIPALIQEIKDIIQRFIGVEFDGILVNYYPDGKSSIGYHSDPIEDKWDNKFVVLSFGDTRNFIFREKENKDKKYIYEFKDGDLIYMFDDCQERFEHSVRKNKNSSNERLSLVFKKRI